MNEGLQESLDYISREEEWLESAFPGMYVVVLCGDLMGSYDTWDEAYATIPEKWRNAGGMPYAGYIIHYCRRPGDPMPPRRRRFQSARRRPT